MASKDTVAKAFVLLAANWPNYTFTEMTIATYHRLLEDLPDDVLEAAVLDCIASLRFWPSVAEVRDAALNIVTDMAHQVTEYDAWAEVKRAVSRPHTGWSDPLIGRAIESIGGIAAFGMSDLGDEPSWRSRFVESFRILRARQRRDMAMLPQVRHVTEQLARGRAKELEAGE